MLTIVIKAKITTYTFLVITIVVFTLGCSSYQVNINNVATPVVANIVYFIPTDEAKVEDLFTLDKLIEQQSVLSIDTTSDWFKVTQLVDEGKVKALIIHYAALEQVNQIELENLFKQKDIVIAGIGIPGEKLAEMVGEPEFYDQSMGTYGTSEYYFIYTYGFKDERGFRSSRATTDSLKIEDGLDRMLKNIWLHTLTKDEIKDWIESSRQESED